MLASETRQLFEQVEKLASACPQARVLKGLSSITVPRAAPGGFDIMLAIDKHACIICLDQVALEFDRPEHAMELFERALHGDLRIKVDAIGGRPWQWTVERRMGEESWAVENVSGHLVFRFWGARTVSYLQNDFGTAVPCKE